MAGSSSAWRVAERMYTRSPAARSVCRSFFAPGLRGISARNVPPSPRSSARRAAFPLQAAGTSRPCPARSPGSARSGCIPQSPPAAAAPPRGAYPPADAASTASNRPACRRNPRAPERKPCALPPFFSETYRPKAGKSYYMFRSGRMQLLFSPGYVKLKKVCRYPSERRQGA